MDFLDRTAELGRLDRLNRSAEGGLAVVWGRRRIGKTRVLLEWVERSQGVYWMADESSAPEQRRSLAEALELRIPGFSSVDYRDWPSLLARLGRDGAAANFRGPIVIDELPYAVASAPELPAALQRFVDHDGKAARQTLALAGSSQRMMQGLVLDANAPLWGRARETLALRPLPIGFLGRALGFTDPADIVTAWATWGGIPRYWELAAGMQTREAVYDLVLDPMGPLFDEPSRLLLEEFPSATVLRPLLDAIGAGCHRVSEIGGRVGQPATSLARPLMRLQDMDLVARETPFGEPPRSTKRSLYTIADPFLRLWFSVVGPRRSVLMQVPRDARLRYYDTMAPRLVETTWEELCRQSVPTLGDALGGHYGVAQRYWSGQQAEWDIVAERVDGEGSLVGEAKWWHTPGTGDASKAVQALLDRPLPPGLKGPVTRALFVRESPASAVPTSIRVVTAADLVAASA